MAREELNQTFTQLIREVGLDGRGARARPRPHDLRHALAVRTLLDWHRGRRGHRPADAAPVRLSRARRPGQHVLVSGGGPRAARADQPAPGAAAGGALMTALAPALQAFFTDRLITQRNSSPRDDRRLPRHVQAAAALRARADRQAAVRAGHRRSRRAADRRVPQPSRRRPGQQPENPQRQARGDPLLLPVRCARTSRARRTRSPG